MQNFSFCHNWLFRRVTKVKAGQRKKTLNKLNFKKVLKISVGVVLNGRRHGSFSKVCPWKCSKPRFSITGNYLFSMNYFKIQKDGEENHPVQPFFFFFGTDLHVWDICHKTLCLEHFACSSWQLWEPQGAAQNKIFPFLSCVKMQHHEPLLLLCSSIWRRREGENWFCIMMHKLSTKEEPGHTSGPGKK